MFTKSFVSTVLGTIAVAAAAPAASAQSAVVSKHVPAIVQSGTAKFVANMDKNETLHLTLALPLRNQAQLDALLADLYNPNSPNFHKWLSQPAFEARFGALQSDFSTLKSWAAAKGMTVTYQAANNRLIEVDASVDVVNRAFNVTEQTYHDTYLDRDFHAPDREPTTSLPFQLLDVEGIEDSAPKVNHLKRDPSLGIPSLLKAPGTFSSEPVSKASTPSAPVAHVYGSGPANSYLPSDMRAAYYGNGNLTGAGQTVGIFSFYPYNTSDLTLYYANTGMTSTVPITNTIVSGASTCTGSCDDGEQILDIVQVQGMAPGLAGITFYSATSASTELNQMVTDNKAKTLSSSWGGGGFGTASDTYFKQMATQGQSFLNATGDDGGFWKSNYSAPSFDPYITQVGGTNLYTTGPGGAWTNEISWAESGGGYWITGISSSGKYTTPTWQTAAVNTTNLASATYRNVPDMAAEAGFDNPTADIGQFLVGYGGTSYATPRMAGYIALANQQAVANGQGTLGFLNTALYAAGLGSNSTSIYHDITVGSNPGTNSSTGAAGGPTYNAVAGYDLVTGWGSPNGTALLNYLAGAPVPDFGLPASVSVSFVRDTAAQNGSNFQRLSIPITAYNSYSGTVQLSSISGLPAGWSDGSVNGTPSSPFVLGLDIPNTATLGTTTFTLTLTDTSNASLTHTVPVVVTVEKRVGYDFTMSATPVTLQAGATGSTNVLVTPGAGLPDSINLSVSNVPLGVTASFFDNTVQQGVAKNALLLISVAANTTPNTYYITATGSDVEGVTHSVQVPVTVTAPGNLLTNGGFETGDSTGWTFTTVSGTTNTSVLSLSSTLPPHTGNYFALMEGGSTAGVDTIAQTVSIPNNGHPKIGLSFWYWFLTGETSTTTAIDTLTVQLTDTSGNVLTTLGALSNLNAAYYWQNANYDVSAYIGKTVMVKLTANQAGTTYTDFLIDDVAVTVY